MGEATRSDQQQLRTLNDLLPEDGHVPVEEVLHIARRCVDAESERDRLRRRLAVAEARIDNALAIIDDPYNSLGWVGRQIRAALASPVTVNDEHPEGNPG